MAGQGETSQQTGWYLFTLGSGFDRNGSLTNNVYTGGEVVDYAPNALGQATKVGAYANSVSYHPNGAIAAFNYGNGLGHLLVQNLRGLPDRSRDAYSTNVILDDSYDYDENGNVVGISDGLPSRRGDRDMEYDDLDRLTSATSTMFGGTITYTYDVLDNLQTVSGAGRDLRYCYNSTTKRLEFLRTGASNCFTGSATTSFGFDVQGNLAWKNQQNFKFSHDNRLRESIGVATYRYDGQGRRVSSNNPTAGGDLSWMYSIDGKVRRMTDARRMKVQHYMYLGDSLVAIREQDFSGNLLGIKYQHTDALGSPVAVTDAATNVIERSEYEPYGKLLNRPINDAPGFTGHVQDADTGLTYMQQRYYDPICGCFLSVDPVTAYGNGDMRFFNRYAYAFNNPFRFTDPDGRNALAAAVPVVAGGIILYYYYATTSQRTEFANNASRAIRKAAENLIFSHGPDPEAGQGNQSSDGNSNPYDGPVDEPVIVVDGDGNAIPVNSGEQITSSPDGRYQQVRDRDGNATGTRLDKGGAQRTVRPPGARSSWPSPRRDG